MRVSLFRCLPLVAVAAACHNPPPPAVPVSGERTSLDRLAGQWSGTYTNPETGRTGSIVFTLTTGEDHAHGDIVMIPRGMDRPLRPYGVNDPSGQASSSQVLTIEFVRASGDSVSGTVGNFYDPECQCASHSIFRGRIEGDRIRGGFLTFRGQNEQATRGTWEVQRQR